MECDQIKGVAGRRVTVTDDDVHKVGKAFFFGRSPKLVDWDFSRRGYGIHTKKRRYLVAVSDSGERSSQRVYREGPSLTDINAGSIVEEHEARQRWDQSCMKPGNSRKERNVNISMVQRRRGSLPEAAVDYFNFCTSKAQLSWGTEVTVPRGQRLATALAMEVVANVRRYVATWTSGGESGCRTFVTSSHCNPSDPKSLDLLTTSYHTLILSILSTWSPKHTISATAFISFIQSVLNGLPSSSSKPPIPSPMVALFGEHLVDMIWAIDAELDEILVDAKTTITNCGDSPAANSAAALSKARKAKQNAENDKEIITNVVKQLVNLHIVHPAFCRERLDSAILGSVGLISDKTTLDKKEIRTRTGLFYKQNKFNLLREQSEGYSKLTAELTSSLGPAHSSATGQPTESYSSIEDRARPVWEKVISLIGYFDLDPNRALDVILDVLSVHLVTHYSFFLALLSFSPWSASYRRPLMDKSDFDMNVDQAPGLFKGRTLDDVLILADRRPHDARTQGSSPRVMAQVVGFKFAYYQSPDVSEPTPKNLYLTAAILIREGFITLEDLYPHVSPNDIEMDQVNKDYLADVQARIVGAKVSALALAAPLSQDSPAALPVKSKAAPVEQKKTVAPKQPPNQKVGLLTALLAVGALTPAIAIMSKFPLLVNAHPEIADLMLRVLKLSISPLYESLLVTKERNPSFAKPRARYGNTGPPSTNTVDFVFFFPEWVERVPICSSLDDLVDVIEALDRLYRGSHLAGSVVLDQVFTTRSFALANHGNNIYLVPTDPTTKKAIGEADPEHPIRVAWFQILRKYLLPALTLIRGNAVCTVEIWNIIRQYETTARWRLYGEWKSTTYKSHPELRVRQAHVDKESKGILRRLSHNTFDSLSGTVAKLAHSNPCIFFTNAVNQIMAYDNLANVVIQALRYVTNMGFDVLVFIILDALSNPNKERVKSDGVNSSDWLQSLASFTGMLFRRYSADLTPVLKYIVHQLHNGQTTEMIVLRELIWNMAGIEPLPSLSDSQIAAMAGGPVLRIEAIASITRGARLDPGDAVLKGPQRLGRTLLESSLALPLLIQVAQQRDSCVFKAPDAYLKTLASLYDTTHGVLLQYLELLTSPSVVAPQDYANKVLPSLAELGEVYGICAPICMHIIRPVLNAKLLAAAEAMQEKERTANEEAEKRLKAALTAKREPLNSASRVASPGVGSSQMQLLKEDVAMDGDSISPTAPPVSENPWLPDLLPLFDDVKKIAPAKAYDIVGPAFYVSFWQLSTYDLSPPSTKYDDEVANLRNLSRQEDSQLTASSHRARRERYNAFVNTLAQEYKQQTVLRAFTIKRLAREKQHWFSHSRSSGVLVGSIIEHCIQPRCLLSPMDADFCAQIIKVLHTQGTPGFHTLMCYDKASRFLRGVLADLYKWYLDRAQYTADNQTVTRGTVVLHPGFIQKWTFNPIVQSDQLEWGTTFRQIIRKWHRKLGKARRIPFPLTPVLDTLPQCFVECIRTGEFMHVYNTIIVLKEILPVFPLSDVSADIGSTLDMAMEKFVETEERGDLKILGRAASAKSSNDKSKSSTTPANGSATSTRAASTPSAPRAQLASAPTPPAEKSSAATPTTTSAFASIQKPPVVKRVRDTAGTGGDDGSGNTKDGASTPAKLSDSRFSSPAGGLDISRALGKDPPIAPGLSALGKEPPQSPRNHRAVEEKTSRADGQPMPPPVAPSQTQVAQELRETAKQTMSRGNKDDDKRPANETRNQSGSRAPSPRRRTPSPTSRPGTRNHSSESRASGGRGRDRMPADSDEKRTDRDTRQEARDHASALTRRDSLTHNRSDRGARERAPGDKDERDKDRGRDRHGIVIGIAVMTAGRNVMGARAQASPAVVSAEDRALPTRPDPRHNRSGITEEGLGKRRRPADDDPERGSKRSSRKDGHRDDRSRRPPDKDGHDRGRDSDRRRKERDGSDNDSGPSVDKEGPYGGSLRSRISEKEMPPRSSGPDYPLRPEASMRRDDDRDNRKRTMSDREPDIGSGSAELPAQGPKRQKVPLQRNRYPPAPPATLAKRTLPIDRRGKD
ncbi:transcription factor/nuclear export subunit protein 2-domain-containing protein [Mycena rebaudengoi]|nr:transcription factor/nuclear export subunit protein 2-domain-containing protein [Mycena rebaudengoi]